MPSKSWYSKGLRFECTQCGNCCKNHGDYTYVYLTTPEVAAIAGHLELEPEAFLRDYCLIEDGWVTLRMDRPACRFLQEDNRCAIYPVRPRQCSTWPFWQENLKEEVWKGSVKDCCPGLDKGALTPAAQAKAIADDTERWYDTDGQA